MMGEKDHDSHRFGIYGEVKKKITHYHTFGEQSLALGIDLFPFSSPLFRHTHAHYSHNIEKRNLKQTKIPFL
jgi:hypothetical protein